MGVARPVVREEVPAALHEALQSALGERYLLAGVVGRGATALVFRAHDQRFDRPVAVKLLRPELGATMSASRFLREIETAARLQHPHILPIYDAAGEGALLFYIMPLVEGESLRERIARERTLPWETALRLTEQVADALAYAHDRQVLHRDVKPENILLFEGHAMVADFGIAKALAASEEAGVTMPGTGLGTPAYMSPEQAFGEADVDGRADLYSLACVLYEMLDGEPPFAGETMLAILAQKTTSSVRLLRESAGGAPAHVRAELKRAMSHDPSERHAGTREFIQALRTLPALALPASAAVPASAVVPALTVSAPLPGNAVTSIAVLPFANLSGSRDDEFLSDGITEDLIHALANVHGLRVMGRASSFSFKQRNIDARAAGEALEVTAVLDGSVRRIGSRLRLVTHLVDVASGFELWSERFDAEFTDVFTVQDEITRSIVEKLQVRLFGTQGRLVEAPTRHMEAYQEFLRGRFEWNRRTPSSLVQSREHLERATRLDPTFALAHAALADCWVTLAIYGVSAPSEAMEAATAAIDRALALQPGMAEALPARASVAALYRHDWEGAERDFRAALLANGSHATTHHWRATVMLIPRRHYDEARQSLERARQLEPMSAAVEASLAMLPYYQGEYRSALMLLDSIYARYPAFDLVAQFRGLALLALDRVDEAVTTLQALAERSGHHPEIVSTFAVALARSGDDAAARAELDRLLAFARDRYVSPAQLAQVRLALGEQDAALDLLEEAVRARSTDLALVIDRPSFQSLRNEPRFRAILRELRIEQ